jgi:hypothetical protein
VVSPVVGRPGGGAESVGVLARVVPNAGLKRQLILIVVLLGLVAVAGWWTVTHPRRRAAAESAAAVPLDAASKRVKEVNDRAAELAVVAATGGDARQEFQVADSKALLNERGKEVVVAGVLKTLRFSNSKKTLFLEFSEEKTDTLVRGRVELKNVGGDLSRESLQGLVGKRIRLVGVVKLAVGNPKRPEVVVKDRESIQEAP